MDSKQQSSHIQFLANQLKLCDQRSEQLEKASSLPMCHIRWFNGRSDRVEIVLDASTHKDILKYLMDRTDVERDEILYEIKNIDNEG